METITIQRKCLLPPLSVNIGLLSLFQMKTFAILPLILAFTEECFGEPSPPTAKQMVQWIAFTKPIKLDRKKVEKGEFVEEWGKPLWIYSYESEKQTLSEFIVALYKSGSLFAKDRNELEQSIQKEADRVSNDKDFSKYTRVETRSNRRKVYFGVLGLGPGGDLLGGFTTIATIGGRYDLLVCQSIDSEDDVPDKDRLKHPAKPTKELYEIFQSVEQHLLKIK